MKLGSALAFIAGLVLLGVVVADSDLNELARVFERIDWHGATLVMLAFTLAWGAEILAWALTFTARPLTLGWCGALWLVNMVGEALNVVMPFGSLGGEPVKGWLLKRHYAIPYREAAATLVLMQTLLGLAEALFAAVGAATAYALGILPPALAHLLFSAAAVLAAAMVLVIIGLHRRWLRALLATIERRLRSATAERIRMALLEVEHSLVAFARCEPRRCAYSTLLFLLNWIGGAVEVWLIMRMLGAPLTLAQCWVAEAAVVMIRSLTFFVPGQLGSVEAVTVLVIGAIVGPGELGFALCLLRRLRELAWSAVGLAVGLWYNLRRAPATD